MRPVPVRNGQHRREQAGLPVPETAPTCRRVSQPSGPAVEHDSRRSGSTSSAGRRRRRRASPRVASGEQDQPAGPVLRRGRSYRRRSGPPAALWSRTFGLPPSTGARSPAARAPGRRVGKEAFHQTRITALDAGSVEHRPGQGEVGQGVCASDHVVTLRVWAGPPPKASPPSLQASGSCSPYGGIVTRSPLFLAALASAAAPGLDPVSVEGAAHEGGRRV